MPSHNVFFLQRGSTLGWESQSKRRGYRNTRLHIKSRIHQSEDWQCSSLSDFCEQVRSMLLLIIYLIKCYDVFVYLFQYFRIESRLNQAIEEFSGILITHLTEHSLFVSHLFLQFFYLLSRTTIIMVHLFSWSFIFYASIFFRSWALDLYFF